MHVIRIPTTIGAIKHVLIILDLIESKESKSIVVKPKAKNTEKI